MSAELRGPYRLVPPRTYSRQSTHDPRTNLAQHGGTYRPYPSMLTFQDRSPYDASTGSSTRSGRRGDEVIMGNSRPLYSPDIRTGNLGGPPHDQSPESASPSQAQIWAELRHMSFQISSLAEAVTCVFGCLDTIETRLDALESALADADGSHTKKASGSLRGSSNKHPMLKVSTLRYYSPYASRTEVLGSL